MLTQTFAHFKRQVQTWKTWRLRFEQFYHAHALAIMFESAVIAHALGQHLLARMSKRRMAKIVRESNRFRQILVQPQGARDGAADRCDLDRMRKACAQMIAGAVEKNLRLVLQAAERAGMNDARTIALKFGTIGVTQLGVLASARFTRFLSNRGERRAFALLHFFARLPLCAHLWLEDAGFERVRKLQAPGPSALTVATKA